ncbi:MAG: GIY-YIG nuclease family protein [Acidimicrobiia bacterium]|nr:GIY-YIG nuclease family protein [Acidimicrobiia bacterium]
MGGENEPHPRRDYMREWAREKYQNDEDFRRKRAAYTSRWHQKTKHADVCYLIVAGESVKIGHSTNIAGRLRKVACHNQHEPFVLCTIAGGATSEARLHELFAEQHKRREWFAIAGKLLTAAKEIEPGTHYKLAEFLEVVGCS